METNISALLLFVVTYLTWNYTTKYSDKNSWSFGIVAFAGTIKYCFKRNTFNWSQSLCSKSIGISSWWWLVSKEAYANIYLFSPTPVFLKIDLTFSICTNYYLRSGVFNIHNFQVTHVHCPPPPWLWVEFLNLLRPSLTFKSPTLLYFDFIWFSFMVD